jgi:CubicO group peptidase (beta-lactamase class C family)
MAEAAQTSTDLPDWIVYPGEDWTEISPEEAGLDSDRFAAFLAGLDARGASFGGEDHSGRRWGAALTRGGYLIHAWGDRHYRFQTASTGKALSWALIGFAAEDGLLDPDAPLRDSWTGEGLLSHPHKYLDQGHHRTLTWRHLIGERTGSVHYGGFPIELGNRWMARQTGVFEADVVDAVAEWATWTGDPFFDCYAHTEPGTQGLYSSGGFWRLGQALTAVWGRDLKDVIDERLFSWIGIPAERWDWLTGDYVHKEKYFYPALPDSYTYLDPPYEIEGNVVRSGPGWVVVDASDLARFGHLIATGGVWNGERIIDAAWLRGHGGGNGSGVSGESAFYTSIAVVTTDGLHPNFPRLHNTTTESFIPASCFVGTPTLARTV